MPSKRKDALMRLILGIIWYLVSIVTSWVLIILVGAYFIIDVLWQLITGGEGLSSGGGLGGRVLDWHMHNYRYIAFGEGDFQVMP